MRKSLQELIKLERYDIMTTIRELLKTQICIDVYDNLTEKLGIAFCGPIELTEEGMKKFGDLLDYKVNLNKRKDWEWAVVEVSTEKEVNRLCELFESLAGYCSESDYDKWFKDPDDIE